MDTRIVKIDREVYSLSLPCHGRDVLAVAGKSDETDLLYVEYRHANPRQPRRVSPDETLELRDDYIFKTLPRSMTEATERPSEGNGQ